MASKIRPLGRLTTILGTLAQSAQRRGRLAAVLDITKAERKRPLH